MTEKLHGDTEFLFRTILSIKDEKECEAFFAGLCPCNELEAMAQRLTAAKLLMAGETYEKIISETDISSATLSRVSRCVKYGEGYSSVLKKLSGQ